MKLRLNPSAAPRTRTFLLWVGAYCSANIFTALLTFNLIKTADASAVGTYGLLLQLWPLYVLQALVLKRELAPFARLNWFLRSLIATVFSLLLLNILTGAADSRRFDQLPLVLIMGG